MLKSKPNPKIAIVIAFRALFDSFNLISSQGIHVLREVSTFISAALFKLQGPCKYRAKWEENGDSSDSYLRTSYL
jgi:hypothetical protein